MKRALEMKSVVVSSPERSEFDVKETCDFLEKIQTENIAAWVWMTNNSETSDDTETTRKKISDAYKLAKGFLDKSKHIKALQTTEKTISAHGVNQLCSPHHLLQGEIFSDLAKKTEMKDIKCIYLFASIDAYSTCARLCPESLDAVKSLYGCARSLVDLGDELLMGKFYEKAVCKARRGLSLEVLKHQETCHLETQLKALMDLALGKIKIDGNAAVTVADTSSLANQMESGKKEDSSIDRLKKFWAKLDGKSKKELLVVDSKDLVNYIQNQFGDRVKRHFGKCVCVDDQLQWRWWKCHVCDQVNYCFTDCKRHLLDSHVNKFEPKFSSRPECVDKSLAHMICSGNWEPVDTEAAANLIIARIESKEDFVYVNGWCNDWPVANDAERRNILKQFGDAIKSSCSNDIDVLSRTLWDWIIEYTEEHLKLPGVPGGYLDKWSFFKNPHCICFLDVKSLECILKYFRQLTTDVCATLVSTVANRLWQNSLVKERIDLERVSFNLLLDERLLSEGEHHDFDVTGTVRTFKSGEIYDNVIPKGDRIISWILDCPEIDEKFAAQMAEGVHNLEIWMAALRIIRCTARKEVSYYEKRDKLLNYAKMLGEAETICNNEDNRKNADQKRHYAFMLGVECENPVKQGHATKCFLNVVRDVFEGAESPSFEVLEDGECISKLSASVQDADVRRGVLKLRNSLKEKFLLIEKKIFLNEYMYGKLQEFPKLSAIENRLVVLPLVKKFLQDKLKRMMKTHNRAAVGDSDEPAQKRRATLSEAKQD